MRGKGRMRFQRDSSLVAVDGNGCAGGKPQAGKEQQDDYCNQQVKAALFIEGDPCHLLSWELERGV